MPNIKHLTETDFNNLEESWRTYEAAYQRTQAQFETKQTAKVICWHCGFRTSQSKQACDCCGKDIAPF